MIKCRDCGKTIEEGEEAMICFEWIAKFDSSGIPEFDWLGKNIVDTPYYYHEKCLRKKRK